MEDIFEQIIQSAQNYRSMPNVIKYQERRVCIKSILNNFDFDHISRCDVEVLYQKFRSEFKDVEDFKSFVAKFDYNLLTRMAMPLLISTKINGLGFALACDFLKELGYTSYLKPDVHLIQVFVGSGLSFNKPISVFEAIVRMAEDCKEIDPEITPYKIDKVIWLICSGKFYLDQITIGMHKEEFIKLKEGELK